MLSVLLRKKCKRDTWACQKYQPLFSNNGFFLLLFDWISRHEFQTENPDFFLLLFDFQGRHLSFVVYHNLDILVLAIMTVLTGSLGLLFIGCKSVAELAKLLRLEYKVKTSWDANIRLCFSIYPELSKKAKGIFSRISVLRYSHVPEQDSRSIFVG